MISSTGFLSEQDILRLFQSRNRGSFNFKQDMDTMEAKGIPQFQSRNRGSFDFKPAAGSMQIEEHNAFQSRNRGSFNFKFQDEDAMYHLIKFPSRNRGSFDFKYLAAPAPGTKIDVSIS